jgi:hypothetical protein
MKGRVFNVASGGNILLFHLFVKAFRRTATVRDFAGSPRKTVNKAVLDNCRYKMKEEWRNGTQVCARTIQPGAHSARNCMPRIDLLL